MSNDAATTLTNMARQLLTSQTPAPLDRAEIEQAVRTVAPIVTAATAHEFTADELVSVIRVLEGLFVVEQGEALTLKDRRRPPEWYVGERRRPGRFMTRYLQKVAEDGWPIRSVEELRDSTAKVLELLDDPRREGPWDWRGLVVGDVQSGKTAHYAGVINRAADAGYRVIVVLAGMHNVLRLQTQQRLESDFLGWDTNPDSASPDGRRRAIGVGRIPPPLIVDSLTVAIPNGDFSLRIARQANFAPLTQPCLLVVKKNASILKNLNRWITRLPDESRAAPLLVIDDEADQASIDTRDQPLLPDGTFDDDYDPTRINGEIRKLLSAFNRSAYVGYTATPFANILMHDERSAQLYGADLFPSTFIVSLSAPDDYFGPVAVFGTNDEGDQGGLPLVRYVDQSDENWIPDRHDKSLRPTYHGDDRIPPSLERAIDAFLLACATRSARGQDREHNSMLAHVSRFVDVHDAVHRQVLRYLDTTRALISGGDRETLDRLRRLWEDDFVPTNEHVRPTVFGRGLDATDWAEVVARLPNSADKIRVIVTNGRSKAGLDYEAYKETGLSVIAIGGDKLSRGLTLEGLTVSYFLRLSKQYDSLLQMGRWFGYRRGFADVCRLYTTPDMEDWFRHVATANQELRSQLAHMQLMLATPKEYGLRVAAHSIMGVTAVNKQRYAVQRQVGYAGEGKIQTVMFRDAPTVEQNVAVTDSFIESLGAGTVSPPRPGTRMAASGELWTDVPGRDIAVYLRNLAFPPENYDIEGGRMASYIEGQIAVGELTDWTVFLAMGDRGTEVELAGRRFRSIQRRARADRDTTTRFIVKSILNPPDEAIDLSAGEFDMALQETNKERRLERKAETDRPSGPNIRAVRGQRPQNGLLILYPLDPVLAEVGTARPLMGVVTSFPESATAIQRLYLENTVRQREQT
ncbi:Z1 domain-containing protein [Chelativorans sp. M5D2P16]|uniref:Z1 domain-containing protein n=1 Tax=Chelativorans sp. M5D2P16 TaxID=3095678 RepID=UPI002ACA40CC|nr:Z1 domain-containing protein [Chelativorans sp. M5D2P16]MDZ5698643.1 Z1 domain-containing protein [Chelativorans sp. M5D2P16]